MNRVVDALLTNVGDVPEIETDNDISKQQNTIFYF